MAEILVVAVVLVTIVPFLPLLYFTWSGYREDVARVEGEITSTNEQVASLASRYMDQLVRRMEQESASLARTSLSQLHDGLPGVAWELIDLHGTVVESTLPGRRKDGPSGYEAFLAGIHDPRSARLSGVDRWVPGAAPTVLLARRLPALDRWLVAIVEPEVLHQELTALSGHINERHVYVVDSEGHLLFHSDLEVSRRAADLRTHPPIKMFLAGSTGAIRFDSVVTGRERLGTVSRVPRAGWGVVVTADVGQRVLSVRSRYLALAWSTVFGCVVAVLILLWATRRLARPLLQIRDALRGRKAGGFQPLAVPDSARRVAEHDELVSAFDELSQRVATTELELLHAERVASVGQLASGLAHEIGTPLNIIKGNAQHALRKMDASDAGRATLELVIVQTERIADLIRRLLDYARPGESRMMPLDLAGVVTQALEMIRGLNTRVEICLDIDPETPPVMGDPAQLEQAILNLLVNAYQAMPDGGRLSVIVGMEDDTPGDERCVCCKVVDDGCGIWPEDKDKLFQPFFTTKEQGQGTGLGLAIVDRIARQHSARVDVFRRCEGGTVFSLHLRPAHSAAGGETLG